MLLRLIGLQFGAAALLAGPFLGWAFRPVADQSPRRGDPA
jgi:hypothetical protein